MAITSKLLFFILIWLSATAAVDPRALKEDAEVSVCKQQCLKQQHYTREETEICLQLCDEYGREKEERQKKDDGPALEEIERQRERCNHQCRVAQLSEDEEKECRGRCEEQYWEERRKLEEEDRKMIVNLKMLKWAVQALYGRA